MTQRVAPGAQGSTVRNMEYGEMGGAPAPFLVPLDKPTRSLQRWDGLPNSLENTVEYPRRGPFAFNDVKYGDNYVTLQGGEGFVDGWFASDEQLQSPDLSSYQQEIVTLVVGWNPDAVYSSSVHSSREDADEVFCGLERNVADDKPYIPILSDLVIADGSGGYDLDRGSSQSIHTDLRPIGRPIESVGPVLETDGATNFNESAGPGVGILRGRPSAPTGGIATGPTEPEDNADRAVFNHAPANNGAANNEKSILTLLQSGGLPAVYVERLLDGRGSAYLQQLQTSLGRLARLNANLSWEYDTFSEIPNWSSGDGGVSTWTYSTTGLPRRIHIEHDGSSGSDDFGSLLASPLVTVDSLGGFAITYKDVSATVNNADNYFRIGITDQSADGSDFSTSGNAVYYSNSGSTDGLGVTSGGSKTESGLATNVDWSVNHNVTISYQEGVGAKLFIDGELVATNSTYTGGSFSPVIQLKDDGAASVSEVVEAEQVAVESLSEVLR